MPVSGERKTHHWERWNMMEPRKPYRLLGEMHPPTRRDRLSVLLLSFGLFVLLLPIAGLLHGHLVGRIVILLVIGVPVMIINILLPFSRFPKGEPTEAGEEDGEEIQAEDEDRKQE